MKFRYRDVDFYPKLAWCAWVPRGTDTIDVAHGTMVETREPWFCDGVWSGKFDEGNFATSDTLLGSGGQAKSDCVVFATSTHTLERLYIIEDRDATVISNSLPVILNEADEAVDLAYPFYGVDFRSFTNGTERACTLFPLESKQLRVAYCKNVQIDRHRAITVQDKSQTKTAFVDYESYREYLTALVEGVYENATDRRRENKYRPLATLSSGYDSPACAVLATEVGCERAVTIDRTRASMGRRTDTGRQIGELLGLSVSEHGQNSYLRRQDNPEVEFLATGMGGMDVVFSSFEEHLSGSLLFTGYLGDTVWGKSAPNPRAAREHQMTYPAGASLSEFRLRLGFVHFPVPQVQRPIHPSIYEITASAEMKPWSVGGDYDRPIPRRIVEAAGVPREWFGKKKKAVSQPFHTSGDVFSILSESSADKFVEWANGKEIPSKELPSIIYKVRKWLYETNRRIEWKLGPLLEDISVPSNYIQVVPERFGEFPEMNMYLFHWAIQRLQKEVTKG